MIESKRRTATLISWKSPEDEPLSLTPLVERGGILEVEIDNGAVTIYAKTCRLTYGISKGDKQRHKSVADAEITIPLKQCQIYWTFIEEGTAK